MTTDEMTRWSASWDQNESPRRAASLYKGLRCRDQPSFQFRVARSGLSQYVPASFANRLYPRPVQYAVAVHRLGKSNQKPLRVAIDVHVFRISQVKNAGSHSTSIRVFDTKAAWPGRHPAFFWSGEFPRIHRVCSLRTQCRRSLCSRCR